MRTIRLTLGLAAAVALTVVPAGPAKAAYWHTTALWHMNEAPGAVSMGDSSGHRNHGGLRNVTTGTTGYSSYGFYFPSHSIATVPSSTSLNPGTLDITLFLDVQTTARVRNWNVAQKGYATTSGGSYKVEILPRDGGGGVANCVFRGSTGQKAVLSAGPDVADGRWHRIICAKYSNSIALKVDDGPVYRKYVRVGSISNSEPLTIGSKAPGDDQYIGRIDEAMVQVFA